MDARKKSRSRIRLVLIWTGVVVLVALCVYISALAFPWLFFGESIRTSDVVLHFRNGGKVDIPLLAKDVNHRLQASGLADPADTIHVYMCDSPRMYTLFARLAFTPPEAQGFIVTMFHNVFISLERIKELGRQNPGSPKYGIWEGNYAHTIAHEVGHDYFVRMIGSARWQQLPHWKREGLPEYVANIGPIREDRGATLQSRLEILRDDDFWISPRSWDRIHYEAGLLVEFLLEVKGYTIEQMLADSVTADTTMAALAEWARLQQD